MKKMIILTMEEIKQLKVLTLDENGNLARAETAKKLDISKQQLYRIQKVSKKRSRHPPGQLCGMMLQADVSIHR